MLKAFTLFADLKFLIVDGSHIKKPVFLSCFKSFLLTPSADSWDKTIKKSYGFKALG